MATYKVIKPGFYDGVYHYPDDPAHNKVVTKKAFKKVPSWLKKVADTKATKADTKADTKAEVDAALNPEDPALAGPVEL